jgi:hypothetical protein
VGTVRVKFIFAWYDFWIGFYWDRDKKRLYFFPIPMFGIYIDFGGKKEGPYWKDLPQPPRGTKGFGSTGD